MHEENHIHTFHTILSRVLGVRESEISDTMSPSTVPTWDSYNALMLVSELEGGFHVKFSMEEIVTVKNVGDVKALLRKHGVAL